MNELVKIGILHPSGYYEVQEINRYKKLYYDTFHYAEGPVKLNTKSKSSYMIYYGEKSDEYNASGNSLALKLGSDNLPVNGRVIIIKYKNRVNVDISKDDIRKLLNIKEDVIREKYSDYPKCSIM